MFKKINNLQTEQVQRATLLLTKELLESLNYSKSRSSLDSKNNVIWLFNVEHKAFNVVRMYILKKSFEVYFEKHENNLIDTKHAFQSTEKELKAKFDRGLGKLK